MQPRSIKLGSPNAATGQCHDALQAALEMTAKPGLPGFPEVATACQHGRLSHTILYPSRLQQILQEFKWYSFVGLQGTQKRTDHAVVQYHCGSHMVFEWGCTAGDKAAGVLLAIRSRLSQSRNVVRVHTPPIQFQGRVGAVRLRRGDADFYVPVERHSQAQRSYNERLWAWVQHLVDSLPNRCVPVLLLDANGRTSSVGSDAVGLAQPQRKNFNGSLHHDLFAVNTFFPAGDTYYGCFARNGRIDYVCLPQTMRPRVRQCCVLHAAGDRLQIIPSPGKREHRPLLVCFEHELTYTAGAVGPMWDPMRLAQSVLQGQSREPFLAAVEAQCAQNAEWEFLESGPPGPLWDKLNRIVLEAGQLCYSKVAARRNQPRDTAQAAEELCEARAELAAMPKRVMSSRHYTYQDLSDMLVRWRAVAQHGRRQRELDVLAKRDRTNREMRLLDEYDYAWIRRDMAQMWATARQLSGKAIGPKNRCYRKPVRERPDHVQWQAFLKQPGSEGGCQAESVRWEHFVSHEDAGDVVEHDTTQVCADAAADFLALRREVHRLRLRKTVPAWSCPVELWRQLLHPRYRRTKLRRGVGFEADPLGHSFTQRMVGLMRSIRRYGRSPAIWHRSSTAQIDKHNTKSGPAGIRLINMLDPLGRAFYNHLWKTCNHASQRDYAAGYTSHRSRLEPILQQHCLGWRLRKAKVSHNTSFHDAANVFYSVDHSELDRCISTIAPSHNVRLLLQRHRAAVICVHGVGETADVRLGAGTLQGEGVCLIFGATKTVCGVGRG